MAPHIESYEFGRIVIDGNAYSSDLIICPDRVITDWWRKDGHGLYPEDLEKVMDLKPEKLIIGCGANNILKVPDSTRKWLAGKGIELIDLPTKEACDKFNDLSSSGKVIAGLHLTC